MKPNANAKGMSPARFKLTERRPAEYLDLDFEEVVSAMIGKSSPERLVKAFRLSVTDVARFLRDEGPSLSREERAAGKELLAEAKRQKAPKGDLVRPSTSRRPSTSDVFAHLAETAGITPSRVRKLFQRLTVLCAQQLRSAGAFVVPELMTLQLVTKPLTRERQGINPFTKEPLTIPPKPAARKIRVSLSANVMSPSSNRRVVTKPETNRKAKYKEKVRA